MRVSKRRKNTKKNNHLILKCEALTMRQAVASAAVCVKHQILKWIGTLMGYIKSKMEV